VSVVKTFELTREQWIPQPIDRVFAFFGDAKNLEAITPPWLGFRILSPEPIEMNAGARIAYRLKWHWLPIRWVTEIRRWDPPTGFIDVQLRGPYRHWYHSHRFLPVDGGTLMHDVVRYGLPLGVVGQIAHSLVVRSDLKAIFDYREQRVSELLADGERS
jgi:ligand-binding SRPBCC domain-containing protein